jgi:hypothetical protein
MIGRARMSLRREQLVAKASEPRRLASDIISGSLGFIDGSRRLLDLQCEIGVGLADADFGPLERAVSATLHLPIGTVRQYWATDALREKDVEIREAEERWGESVRQTCRALLNRFKVA